MHSVNLHLTRGPKPTANAYDENGYAVAEIECEGATLRCFVSILSEAQAIADGFNRAFPKPIAEAAE